MALAQIIKPGSKAGPKTGAKWKAGTRVPKLHYRWVPPADFRRTRDLGTPDYGSWSYNLDKVVEIRTYRAGGHLHTGNVIAPLRLPHGATLREIRAAFDDHAEKMHGKLAILGVEHHPTGKVKENTPFKKPLELDT